MSKWFNGKFRSSSFRAASVFCARKKQRSRLRERYQFAYGAVSICLQGVGDLLTECNQFAYGV